MRIYIPTAVLGYTRIKNLRNLSRCSYLPIRLALLAKDSRSLENTRRSKVEIIKDLQNGILGCINEKIIGLVGSIIKAR